MLNNAPWSPEHIYQEITGGYGTTRQRGKLCDIQRFSEVTDSDKERNGHPQLIQ